MKLFDRMLKYLLSGVVFVLFGWAVCFYMGIMEEINDEVDDSLEDYSELIIIRSLAGEELHLLVRSYLPENQAVGTGSLDVDWVRIYAK